MSKAWRPLSFLVIALILAGCATMSINTITNLTSSRLPRKESGQYMFSVEFLTRQRTLIHETMRVSVVLGTETFPMSRTPLVTNRWETLVSIPANQDAVNYFFHFEYDYKAIPTVRQMSRDSELYRLELGDW